jgi:2'-5' RNA ligase
MVRCFIAVNLNEEIKRTLGELRKNFEDLPLRFVKPESMHITLKFLGEVDERKLEKLMKKMDEIKVRSFEIRVQGVGVFPSERYPRVLWAGVSGDFRELHKEVERITRSLGFPKDDKPFKPHITIARLKNLSASERAELIERMKNVEFQSKGMKVESVELMKSTLLRTGAIYEALKTVRLHES